MPFNEEQKGRIREIYLVLVSLLKSEDLLPLTDTERLCIHNVRDRDGELFDQAEVEEEVKKPSE